MRQWLGLALVSLGLVATARAQHPNLVADPVPFASPLASQPPPPPAPPWSPMAAYMSLPPDLPNAWCDDWSACKPCPSFHLGYIGLDRERLGRTTAALHDRASAGQDTGNPVAANAEEALNFHQLNPEFGHGVKVGVGLEWGVHALEASGFYISQATSTRSVESRGGLNTPFNGAGSFVDFPTGFEGTNLLWSQADIVRLQLRDALASGEVNYRCWWAHGSEFCSIVGARYVDFYERLGFYTGDDDLTVFDINGQPDPIRQALYNVTTHNRIVAGQAGFEWNKELSSSVTLSCIAKGAWGVNFLDVNTALKRGDGLLGPTGDRSDTIFSHLYEAGFFVNIPVLGHANIRAGYNLLWLVDIAEATEQFDYNLFNAGGRVNEKSSVFFHGPSVEVRVSY